MNGLQGSGLEGLSEDLRLVQTVSMKTCQSLQFIFLAILDCPVVTLCCLGETKNSTEGGGSGFFTVQWK